jgi:O-antigen ligase
MTAFSGLRRQGERFRDLVVRHRVAEIMFYVLIASFFLLETRLHRNLFYLFLPFFIAWLARREIWQRLGRSRLCGLVLLYMVYFWVSQFWSSGYDPEDFMNATRIFLFIVIFLAFGITLFERAPTAVAKLSTVTFVVASVTAGMALILFLATSEPFHDRFEGFGRAGHPILGAHLYAVALLVVVAYLLPRAESLSLRLLYESAVVLFALVIGFSLSRGPILAVALTIILIALLRGNVWIYLSAGLLLVTIPVVYAIFGLELGDLVSRGASSRPALWSAAWELIGEAPLFGHGLVAEVAFRNEAGILYRSPHNILLANLVHGGVVALALVLAIYALAFAAVLRQIRQPEAFLAGALLLFGFLAGQTDYRLFYVNLNPEWLTFWLPLAILGRHDLAKPDTPALGQNPS